MIVDDFYVRGPFGCPDEADSPLLVDADAVLSLPIIFQRLESISGWHLQVVKNRGPVQLCELAEGGPLDVHPPLHPLALKERLGVLALEAFDSHVWR